jgi:hypothetical protein
VRRLGIIVLFGGWLAAGCDSVNLPSQPPAAVPAPVPGGGGGGDAAAILSRDCVWCHTTAHPAANIDLTLGTLTPTEYDRIGNGVALEMAPFISRLPASDKRALLDWVRARGGAVPTISIPSHATWRLSDAIADLPDGAQAPGFAFVIEDAYIDDHAWTVQSFTDNHGMTARGIQLDQTHSVDQSVFSSSRNPSSYLVFPDIAWHGRFFNSRIEGDVRVRRWMSIGMHAKELQPTGRSHRQYVRLQIDRDAISLRSAPTALETWPWGNTPDGRLTGQTDASGFYLTGSEWLHFVFQARSETGGVRWTARVTNAASGAVIADLSAFEASTDPLEGTFFLHGYSVDAGRMWANLVFDADIDPSD